MEGRILQKVRLLDPGTNDPCGYRRLAAIEGRVYTRPVERKSMTFYFVYHSTAVSLPDA